MREMMPVNQLAKVLIGSEQDDSFPVAAREDRVVREARGVFRDARNLVSVAPQTGDHRTIHALVGEYSHAERRSNGTINSLRTTAAA